MIRLGGLEHPPVFAGRVFGVATSRRHRARDTVMRPGLGQDEIVLLRELQSNRAEAVDALLAARGWLWARAERLSSMLKTVGSIVDADDLRLEMIIKLHRRVEHMRFTSTAGALVAFDRGRPVAVSLNRILWSMLNEAYITELRKAQAAKRPPPTQALPEVDRMKKTPPQLQTQGPEDDTIRDTDIEQALRQIPEPQRTVLSLRRREYTFQEISTAIGKPLSTTYQIWKVGASLVRAALAEKPGGRATSHSRAIEQGEGS